MALAKQLRHTTARRVHQPATQLQPTQQRRELYMAQLLRGIHLPGRQDDDVDSLITEPAIGELVDLLQLARHELLTAHAPANTAACSTPTSGPAVTTHCHVAGSGEISPMVCSQTGTPSALRSTTFIVPRILPNFMYRHRPTDHPQAPKGLRSRLDKAGGHVVAVGEHRSIWPVKSASPPWIVIRTGVQYPTLNLPPRPIETSAIVGSAADDVVATPHPHTDTSSISPQAGHPALPGPRLTQRTTTGVEPGAPNGEGPGVPRTPSILRHSAVPCHG